jgi:hypothetical protein
MKGIGELKPYIFKPEDVVAKKILRVPEPNYPSIPAEEWVVRVCAEKVETYKGSVHISTDRYERLHH